MVLPRVEVNLYSLYNFHEKHCGSLHYLYRRRNKRKKECREPVVFFHGLGVGLTMYFPFIRKLVEKFGERYDIFLIILPHIGMRFTDSIPS